MKSFKTLVAVLALLCSYNVWAYNFEADGIYYNITSDDDFTCEVTYKSSPYIATYSGDIVIPTTIKNGEQEYIVTGIGEYAFNQCEDLTSIEIPDGVTYLKRFAFDYCTSLTTITIPNSVTSLGQYAVGDCTKMTSITLSNNLTTIETGAFYGLTSLEYIELPNTVTSLGSSALSGCTSLLEIVVPSGVTQIESSTFYKCSSLKTVSIGYNVSNVAANAFNGCTALESFTSNAITPPNVANANAFTNVPTETCVLHVPSQSVEDYKENTRWSVFTNIEGFELELSLATLDATDVTNSSATLNATVTNTGVAITEQGFEYWSNSDDVMMVTTETGADEMSATVTGLTKNTTYTYHAYAKSEDDVTYGQDVTFTTELYDFSVDGISYDYSTDESTCVVTYGSYDSGSYNTTKPYTGEIVIPETVEYEGTKYTVVGINSYAFYNCVGLTSIETPSTVTSIGQRAFSNCTSLTDVTFDEGLLTIGDYAFYVCSALKGITLPSTLSEIGASAFRNCTSMESIVLPNSVTSVGTYTFEDCPNLKEAVLSENLTYLSNGMFFRCYGLEKVELPASLVTINGVAFENCTSLTTMKIPGSVTSIGGGVFEGCTSLTTFTFEDGDEELALTTYSSGTPFTDCPIETLYLGRNLTSSTADNPPFKGITTLTSLTIGDKVTTLEASAFEECTNLSDLNLGNSLTAINNSVFSGCTDLTQVTLPESVTSIGSYAFNECTGLAEINIPDATTSIGQYAFYGCTSLSEVIIPDAVTSLGQGAYRQCSGITTVTLGNSVASIGQYAFEGCTGIEEISIPASVTSIGNQAFSGCTNLTILTLEDGEENISLTTSSSYTPFTDCPIETLYIGKNFTSSSSESPAFKEMTSVTTLTLGEAITSIENSAFSDCSSLVEVTSLNPEPPTCGTDVFTNIAEGCALYVPDGAYDDYSTADTWKDFFIVEMVEFRVETLEATDVAETSAVLNGTVIEAWDEPGSITSKGFVYWSDDPNVITTIIIIDEDVDMSYTLNSLTPETTYTYRAFAVTDNGTTYGEDVEFTTLEDTTTGINGISLDSENVEGIYSTSGQKLNSTVNGVNIIRYSDGTVKKLYVE